MRTRVLTAPAGRLRERFARRGLPVSVVLAAVSMFAATVLAGAASVGAVGTQDRLLERQAEISRVVAESGRAEALVAQLADPRTNPAALGGMRGELAASARRIAHQAQLWAAQDEPDDRELADLLRRSAPELATLAADFAESAAAAAGQEARIEPGQLIRGSVDGLYPELRRQADDASAAIVWHADTRRTRWVTTVSAVLAVAAAASITLSYLMFGPVSRRLTRQRLDAARVAAARDGALTQLRAVLDSVDVPVVVADADGRHVTGNQAARRLFPDLGAGSTPVAALQGTWHDLPLAVALRTGAPTSDVLLVSARPAGQPGQAGQAETPTPRRFAVDAHPVSSPDGTRIGAVATLQDITDLHERNEHLTRHAAHLAAIGQATNAVLRHEDARAAVCEAARDVVSAELATLFEDDGHGDLVCTASAGADVFGLRLPVNGRSVTASVFANARPRTTLAVDDEPDADSDAVQALSKACGRPLSAGVWMPVVSGGRCRAVLAIGFSRAVNVTQHLTTLEIIAAEAAVALDRQDLMRRLAQDAESDPLTGAANRRAWDAGLPRAVYTARATGSTVSVIMLDLDHFKHYNDAHGHPAGDLLLRQAVSAWRGRLRPDDTLARYGGEEFAVILPDCTLDAAARVADSLRQLVPAGQTCSAGVAELRSGDSPTALLARADRALYEAKNSGRNRTTAGDGEASVAVTAERLS